MKTKGLLGAVQKGRLGGGGVSDYERGRTQVG